MFNTMNPQLLQMLMSQQGSGSGMPQTSNMAPQLNMQQNQQRSSIAPMPQMPQQQPAIAPNGGILGVANNTGLTSMLGGSSASQSPTGFTGGGTSGSPGMFSQMSNSLFGGGYNGGTNLPWSQGYSSTPLNASQIADPSNQGFFSSLLNGGSNAASAAAPAASASSPDWLTALMAAM